MAEASTCQLQEDEPSVLNAEALTTQCGSNGKPEQRHTVISGFVVHIVTSHVVRGPLGPSRLSILRGRHISPDYCLHCKIEQLLSTFLIQWFTKPLRGLLSRLPRKIALATPVALLDDQA